ncbi:MAG: hypothetical protein ACRD4C_10965 [Candidatus Acidiferrales bacterium]
MASKEEHLAQAEHNEDFIAATDNPFFDWKLIGMFYSALQYVDAYLATQNIHPPDHGDRAKHVSSFAKFASIRSDYRDLKNESRTARYEPPNLFDQGDVNIAQRRLDSIKATLLPL